MIEIVTHSFIHAIKDTLNLLPVLFLAYLLMEALEHYEGGRLSTIIRKNKRLGPLFGALFGIIPQCGFSGGIAGLYAAGTVTAGTLVAVILSTSDEMLPILISSSVSLKFITILLVSKLIIGVVFGFIIDIILRKNKAEKEESIHEFCEREHCSCKDGVFLSALKHTLKIAIIILIVIFALNICIELIPEKQLQAFLNLPVFSQIFASIIGLIPSCSVSVLLTNLYVSGALGISPLLCGLLTNGGVALLVLYKANPNKKANFFITLALFVIGIVAGSVGGLILENIL